MFLSSLAGTERMTGKSCFEFRAAVSISSFSDLTGRKERKENISWLDWIGNEGSSVTTSLDYHVLVFVSRYKSGWREIVLRIEGCSEQLKFYRFDCSLVTTSLDYHVLVFVSRYRADDRKSCFEFRAAVSISSFPI
ncbi:hypothetical protein CEXT_624101 [Caerostris extrusa]|uniref:Uncharacterized protein n=1 Tax=Caerostris extrusa TaxID=172846 RepID=A0AAV4MY28_CAEEX|nr:hypothetical protein CEXT_624101 [Caerostris extrusa]